MESKRGKLLSGKEIIVLFLLALPLLVTVSTIEAAHWVKGLPSLKVLVPVTLVMWAYLARSGVPWWIGHTVSILVGLLIAFVLGGFTIATASSPADLASQLGTWFSAIGSAEGDRGAAMVAMVLIGVTLLMGHATVWLAYRRSFALLAALPGLGVLLVVLTFLPSDYYWYFFMYLLAAAPGIAYRHKGRWSAIGQRVPLCGTLLAGLLLMAATLAPVSQAPTPEGTIFPLVSKLEKPWYSFVDQWSNLFHGVPSRKQWSFFSPPLDLAFRGPVDPGEDVLFVVEAEQAHKWRMRVYDTYVGSGKTAGWITKPAPLETAAEDASLPQYLEELADRDEMKIDVRLYSKSNTLVYVGEPVNAGKTFKVELSSQPSFRLYLDTPQVSYLPPEVNAYRDSLVAWSAANNKNSSLLDNQPKQRVFARDIVDGSNEERGYYDAVAEPSTKELRESGFRLALVKRYAASDSGTQPRKSEPEYLAAERTETSPGPPLALLSQRILVPPRQYSTVGSVSVAEPNMLREAGQDYPHWVTDRYLQLPNNFPETVRRLARELTKDEDNPYDSAEAIRRRLINLPYSLDFVAPPEGKDWVEHFLMVHRKGYCQNYASAMATMLRSLGIPARFVAGFAPGVWNEERNVWEVRYQDYHAWPEVYFPGYGWVEFEPTPADVQPSLGELGFQPQADLQRTPLSVDLCEDPSGLMVGCDEDQVPGTGLGEALYESPGEAASATQAGDLGREGLGFSFLLWTFLALGVAVALVVPMGAVSYVRRGILRLGYPTVTYAYMCFLGRLAGVGLRRQYTPWEYSARLRHEFPEHEQAITHVTQGFVTTRYGPSKVLDEEEIKEVRASWLSVRQALLVRILLRPFRRHS